MTTPTIRRTGRAGFLLVCWLGALAAMIALPHPVWSALAAGFGLLLLLARVWVDQLAHGVRGERHVRRRWVAVGDRLEEWFEIHNHSPLPLLWVELLDASNVPGYNGSAVVGVELRGAARWRRQALCARRGRYTLGPWSLRCGDPFGLFEVTLDYPAVAEIVIHPPVRAERAPEPPEGLGSGQARRRRRTWEATVNAAEVRDYQPNDPFHLIHWRTSARHGDLKVRQFERECAGDIWVVLDTEAAVQLGSDADGTLEHAVLLAAALTARALADGRAVGLAAYGPQPQIAPPGRGRGQQWRLLNALALVAPDPQPQAFERALRDLRRNVARGSAVLLITPRADDGWLPAALALGRSGTAVSAALLDQAGFGGAGQSNALRRELLRLGIAADLLPKGAFGSPTLPTEASQQAELRVTPLGRAVLIDPTAHRADVEGSRG